MALERLLVVLLAALAACDDGGEYAVRVHLPGVASRAVSVEVSVLESCGEVAANLGAAPARPLRQVRAREGVAEPIGTLSAGSYGLYARAAEAGCRTYAAGCQGVTVRAGGSGTLDVFLFEVDERGCDDGDQCVDEVCTPERDAGAPDAAPPPDAGRDAGSEPDAGYEDSGVPCAQPEIVALVEMEEIGYGPATGVVLSEGIAYVARVEHGLALVDVTNPVAPEPLGTVPSTHAADVAVAGTTAYLADGEGGLRIVDVSTPGMPEILATLPYAAVVGGVAVIEPYVYITVNELGLRVIDASDPLAPVEIGEVPTPGQAKDVSLSPTLGIVSADRGGILLLDIMSPDAPEALGGVDTPGRAFAAILDDDLAYVADLDGQVQIVDVSDPSAPQVVGTGPSPRLAADLVKMGVWIYVADYEAGLQILDATDALAPQPAGEVPIAIAGGLAVNDGYAFVTDLTSGLQIVDLHCAWP